MHIYVHYFEIKELPFTAEISLYKYFEREGRE